jgi:hypothetical protein
MTVALWLTTPCSHTHTLNTHTQQSQIISPLGHSAGALFYDCTWLESPPEDTSLDFIDTSVLSKLEGPRPSILRVNYIYGGIKSVYGTVSTLPVVNIFTPMVEGVVENVLSRTPLKVRSNITLRVQKVFACGIAHYISAATLVYDARNRATRLHSMYNYNLQCIQQ